MATNSNDIFDQIDINQSSSSGDIFDQIDFSEQTNSESLPQNAIRQISRTGARGAESILGIPGDVKNLIQNIPGGIASLLGIDEQKISKANEAVKALSPFKGLKTGGELKELTTQVTGDYLKPKNSIEEFSDQVTEFVAPLLVPMKGAGALEKGKKIFSTLAKATGSTAIGNYVQGLTEREGAGNTAQIGSYVLMSLMNPKSMNKYISNLYKEVENSFPAEGKKLGMVKTGNYRDRLIDFRKEISQSLSPSDSQKTIINKIDSLLGKLPEEVNPKRIWETKKSINTDITKLERAAANSSERKLLQNYNKKLSAITKETLKQHGKVNPKLWKAIEAADDAYSTKAQTEWMAKQIQKTLNPSEVPFLAKALPFLFKSGVATAVKSVGAPLYYTARFAARYKKSPALRKYYNQIFKGASIGNAKIVRNSAEKMNEELSKED